MSDLDLTEAIGAAAIAMNGGHSQHAAKRWGLEATTCVAAAAPVIERLVRERIANDIESRLLIRDDDKTDVIGSWLREAVRIARGGAA